MRFLFVTGIYPPEIGGPARVLSELAQDLRQQGHEVVIVTYGEKRQGVQAVDRSGSVLQRYYRMVLAIRSACTPNTIIFATDVFSVGIPARLALIGLSNVFILRLGGEWAWEDAITKQRFIGSLRKFWQMKRGWRGWLERLNYRWITGRAKTVCVTSSVLGEILVRSIPLKKERIILTPNQVAEKRIPQTEPLPHTPLRLLYIGRFAPVKNVPFLARILRELEQEGVIFEANLIGDGPEKQQVEEILQNSKQTILKASLSSTELPMQYLSHDILLLPSYTDICPNVVLEALAHGLPCVITTEHGLDIQGGVMTCDPMDVSAWKQVLRDLIQDPTRVQRLSAAISSIQKPGATSLKEVLLTSI